MNGGSYIERVLSTLPEEEAAQVRTLMVVARLDGIHPSWIEFVLLSLMRVSSVCIVDHFQTWCESCANSARHKRPRPQDLIFSNLDDLRREFDEKFGVARVDPT